MISISMILFLFSLFAYVKEKSKTPEKELNKMEISNLSDAKFKTLVIRMLKELTEYFSVIKRTQTEMKDKIK